MVAKLIRLHATPGHMEDLLAAQRVWNRETRNAAGHLGCFCGIDPNDPLSLQLVFFWRSREDLDRWMATEHDRIAALAGSDAHYETIQVTVLDEVLPAEWPPRGA